MFNFNKFHRKNYIYGNLEYVKVNDKKPFVLDKVVFYYTKKGFVLPLYFDEFERTWVDFENKMLLGYDSDNEKYIEDNYNIKKDDILSISAGSIAKKLTNEGLINDFSKKVIKKVEKLEKKYGDYYEGDFVFTNLAVNLDDILDLTHDFSGHISKQNIVNTKIKEQIKGK